MKKRFLLSLLLFFLPATIIGAAYAGFVYSNKVDTKTDSNSGKIDDVKPNFKLDENNYTIYFFPSMQAVDLNFNNDFSEANIKSKIDGADKSEWGYWTSNNYYPKKIETHGGPSISIEQFESLGEPSTTEKDKKNFVLDFSGWTADKKAAKDGYASQGDYKYISAFDELTNIDKMSEDGTQLNDKIIFVYPIFTTGKDYSNKNKSNDVVQLAASMRDPNKPDETTTKPRYLSRVEGDENATYFYYKNLVIDENDPRTWSLSFSGYRGINTFTRRPTWHTNWGNYKKNYIYKSQSSNSIINEPGIYNLYAYLVKDDFDKTTAEKSDFNAKINSSNMPLIHEDGLNNYSEVETIVTGTVNEILGRNYHFWLFVKIEKVYEFRLAGTEGRGFAFDTAGQLYVSHFSSSDYSGPQLGSELWKMYYLDNVFLEKGKNNLFTEYTNSSGGKYKIRNTVFSFLPSDENLATINGIQQMTPEELNYVNENEPDLNVKGNYKGISDTSFKKIDNSQNEYIKNHVNLPNYVPDKDYADYFFASEFKYSGYCKVLIKVDFGTSGDNKGKPISIHVAVAPYLSNKHKIYVYPEFYKNGEPFDFSYYIDNETKLIDPENNAKLMKHQITSFEVLASNDYQLDGNQDISVVGTAGTMKLSKYLSDYEILDHLTNARIIISGSKPKSYRRHMACWQKGLFSQYNKE